MGNVTGTLICGLVGARLGGRVGATAGSVGGAVFGACVEVGHLVATRIRVRGRFEVPREVIAHRKWEIVEFGVRYCPLNVAPGHMNFVVDCLRHIFAPLGAWRSGVLRHDWVTAKVRGPNGEEAWMVAKKCCDGSIVLAWCKDMSEADIAGMDIVKGCKHSLGKTWLHSSKRSGRRVGDLLKKVLVMPPTYNCIVDNCQDFARELMMWHKKQIGAGSRQKKQEEPLLLSLSEGGGFA
ncbi:hypothetical protein BSKO_07880 [Bryopsis sp. KO-2023]|nr:hypothetical protein BSKO_07880 [Bryopsis sp. KO-2023]